MQRSDFSDLNFENIGVWPLPAKLMLVSAACATIIILAFFLLIKPELTRYKVAQSEEVTLLGAYTEKAGMASNIAIYKHQLVIIKKMLSDVIQQLPKRADIPNLVEDISKLGVASGLEFNLIKPAPEVDKGFYVELPIQLSVTGDYTQLANFVSSVANMPRIVTLDNFKITRANLPINQVGGTPPVKPLKDNELKMDVMAKTYHYEGTKPSSDVKPTTGGNPGG